MRLLAKEGRVIGTDIIPKESVNLPEYEVCDVTKKDAVLNAIEKYKPTHLIHLSAILSGAGEKNPQLALDVNLNGFMNVLEAVKDAENIQMFSPSTIAAFGPSTPPKRTPDSTIMRPTTVYGITKVHMELNGDYYNKRYGVDFRSLRLPGVISAEPIHGMGTTDYAVEMFLKAAKGEPYQCYLRPDTSLPMVYVEDCLKAIIKLIHAPDDSLTQRVYNINGLAFTPSELYEAILRKRGFAVSYSPDFRQAIADSWPDSLRDTPARKDWDWKPNINSLDKLVDTMFSKLK